MMDPYNLEAIRVYIFFLLSRERDNGALLEKFDLLEQAFERNEPRNAELYFNYSRLFARICGR